MTVRTSLSAGFAASSPRGRRWGLRRRSSSSGCRSSRRDCPRRSAHCAFDPIPIGKARGGRNLRVSEVIIGFVLREFALIGIQDAPYDVPRGLRGRAEQDQEIRPENVCQAIPAVPRGFAGSLLRRLEA